MARVCGDEGEIVAIGLDRDIVTARVYIGWCQDL